MSGRRHLKRGDYRKIATFGSDSDNDFEASSSLTNKEKKDRTSKRHKRCKSPSVEKKETTDNESCVSRRRTTKISRADEVFQQELLTAIECSKNDISRDRSKNKVLNNNKTLVISSTESETDDDSGQNKMPKMNSKLLDVEIKNNEYLPVESVECFDTVPVIKSGESFPPVKSDTPLLRGELDSEVGAVKTRKTASVSSCEKPSKAGKHLSQQVNQSKMADTSVFARNSDSILASRRLRIGLSRNVRVVKPLHSNFKIV